MFFFAPLRATLTVEAALVLPMFLMVMIAVLQYGAAMEAAVKFGSAMAETGESLATAAYITRYGGDTSGVPELAASALSEVYAQNKVMSAAGNPTFVKNANMLLSSFLKQDDTIDLVLTYQIKSPFGFVSLPGNFFLQRARVRAWTGRSSGKEEESQQETDEEAHEYVYVTKTGTVYHKDADCTHLKLSIRSVDASALSYLRNSAGGIYHCCEKCGDASPGGTVYITSEGNRYHSSLSCSGLKRTVEQVDVSELGSMRACSKCGG